MQPALQSDQAVQSYIDAMLLDMGDAGAPSAPSLAPVRVPEPGDAVNAAVENPPNACASAQQSSLVSADDTATTQRPVPALPGQQIPLASALAMPGLELPQLKALVQAISQAPAKAQLTVPIQASTSPPANASPQPGPCAKPHIPDRQSPAVAPGSAKLQDNPRSAAFLKHLEDAQARTAARLQSGSVARKRPAALAKAPEWVQDEQLRCLVFKVANLQLALPVQYLSGVSPFDVQQLQAPPDEDSGSEFAALCLGAIGDKLVLDTARLVMPERYAPGMAGQYRQALNIADTNWYFAVDSIGSEQSFKAQDVRWRSQHTRREWLAGTVIDKMCAIVDVESLHRSLLAASVLEAPPQ